MGRTIAIAAAATLLAGCTNLQAVNTASGQLLTATASWDTTAQDWTASCHRRSLMSSTPPDCADAKKATEGLDAADKALANYFTALQKASDAKSFNLDPSIASVATSVEAIPKINTAQVTAVKTFTTYLADLATAALREKTLRSLIEKGGPKAIATIDVLDTVAVPGLKDVYSNEAIDTGSAYSSYIKATHVGFTIAKISCADGIYAKDFSTGDAFLLAQDYCRRALAIKASQDTLESYVQSLAHAKTTLNDMVAGKDNLKDKDLVKALQKDISTLRDDVSTLKKAFG